MPSAKELDERLRAIEARNLRVEGDKAWGGSWLRRGLIMAITYTAVVFYSFIIGVDRPWVGAAVPVMGFLLSTISLPVIKRQWLNRRTTAK